jgi:glyoxylase-like metal-dependent hydrolase (beta-lactamase superfamily II)
MADKDFVTIDTTHLHIEGRSRAGHETWFRVREINAAFDIGRCPDTLIGIPHVFVTHAHLDHAVGIPFYAGQRQLHGMTGGHVYIPAEAAEEMREILAIYERITGASFAEIEVIGWPRATSYGSRRIMKCGRIEPRIASPRMPTKSSTCAIG